MTSRPLKMALYNAKAYSDTISWKAIPLNLKNKYIASSWLATSRLALRTDLDLAKSSVLTSLKHKLTPLGIITLIRVYLKQLKI